MTPAPSPRRASVAIVGAGPAGLIAAEHLARAGHAVAVYDRMASPARKFLLAGRGGLNLTHSEPLERFLGRYSTGRPLVTPPLLAYPPEAVRAWAHDLGEDTFVGTSGRVFPKSFKATPLLRAWLRRLADLGVMLKTRHSWTGWSAEGALTFQTPDRQHTDNPDATLLALGGASWPRLGANGDWVAPLQARGIAITPLAASNCGAHIAWSEPFRSRHQGQPLKGCAFTLGGTVVRAEAVITARGLEGGAIYALSAALRTALAEGPATLRVDLKPDLAEATLAARLATARKGETLSNLLRKKAGLGPVALSLLREAGADPLPRTPPELARRIKSLPLDITGMDGLERAISTAGGIAFEAVDEGFMLKALPGVFVAGEMLDWDAPTGGYLLSACFATGAAAARGITDWLSRG